MEVVYSFKDLLLSVALTETYIAQWFGAAPDLQWDFAGTYTINIKWAIKIKIDPSSWHTI